jgi:hypothetical protein
MSPARLAYTRSSTQPTNSSLRSLDRVWHLEAQDVVVALPGGILHIAGVDGGQPRQQAVAVAAALEAAPLDALACDPGAQRLRKGDATKVCNRGQPKLQHPLCTATLSLLLLLQKHSVGEHIGLGAQHSTALAAQHQEWADMRVVDMQSLHVQRQLAVDPTFRQDSEACSSGSSEKSPWSRPSSNLR